MSEMEKAYLPGQYESDIYARWEKSGAFAPADDPKAEPFTIIMPPPNANGDLHLGHSLTTTLQDIMIRRARMQGRAALFLPGADHAGFETQVVFERHLAEQGKSRFDYPRSELYKMIWEFVQQNKGNMENQQRQIGASADWSRNTFTLDEHIVKLSHQTFKKLWDDDMLYRGQRIVNFCTHHGTSFSDLEVEYHEVKSHIWTMRYPIRGSQEYIEIATTRPETMLGDTAVAVNPKDKRYTRLVGQLIELPLTGRVIPIVADEAVDQQFGTGAVKVTPGHDHTDFEIAERHNLPIVTVIGKDGRITDEAPERYRGHTTQEARREIIRELDDIGVLVGIKDHTHSVGHCYKCKNVIEPLVIDQWLIRMKPLARRAIDAVEQGQIKLVPSSKKKVLYQWLENIRDWNISRQIVWGIQIPAFFAEDGDIIVDTKTTGDTIEHGGKTYTRDPDCFDTWFSSGQWPLGTLHYPDGEDFKRFYPTTVMETASEILLFWVARMIMLGLYLTDEVPFTTVYLHGLVLDDQGKKMSKSKGKALAPAPLLVKYGADALRMGLVANRSAGQNQGFSEKRVEAMRNFCNKLWNVSRYILSTTSEAPGAPVAQSLADDWILEQFSRENAYIDSALAEYRFADAQDHLYHLLWEDLADWYLEASKLSPNPSVLIYCLETILKLAHPFAPFVTETIWQKIPWQSQDLIVTGWPGPEKITYSKTNASEFTRIMALVSQIRRISADLGLKKPTLSSEDKLSDNAAKLIERLARVGVASGKEGGGLAIASTSFKTKLLLDADTIKRYRDSLQKQHHEQEAYRDRLAGQLKNSSYLNSAPPELVEQTRQRLEQVNLLLSGLDEQLTNIS